MDRAAWWAIVHGVAKSRTRLKRVSSSSSSSSDNTANAGNSLCLGEIFFVGNIVVVVQLLSCVQLFVTLWTAAHQASLSYRKYTPK